MELKQDFKEGAKITNIWGHSKYYQEYFKKNEEEFGRFDKVLVSQTLINNVVNSTQEDKAKIVVPFKKLLTTIWESTPEWR